MKIAKTQMPVDAILPEVVRAVCAHRAVVIEAAPGAGKTTRVPPALLTAVQREVLVLEPRRIAARMAARRVAAELGESAGGTVGYQVRFEEVSSPRTRLRYMTEGVLTRRLIRDPLLESVDAVVLDEFHERHLDTDLALALLRQTQVERAGRGLPGLRLILMSATLESAALVAGLEDCVLLRSEGTLFDTAIEHLPYAPVPLADQVSGAVKLLLEREPQGHILVFLPGAAEIRQTARACTGVAERAGLLVLPLYGELSAAEQDRAVQPSRRRKLILATNIAESSITVEGVTGVIDSGLARYASWSPWSGLPTLEVRRISQASARQRAGRAGRTAPGTVLRLYSREDFAQRPEHDTPEILRSDLSQVCLTLRAMGRQANTLPWLDAPPPAALAKAARLLDALGAEGARAREMAQLPVAPRLARILIEAAGRNAGEDACRVVALLSAGLRTSATDLMAALDEMRHPRADAGVSHLRVLEDQLRRALRPRCSSGGDENALLLSILSGFPDRVARLRGSDHAGDKFVGQVAMCSGASAEMQGAAPPYEFMLALDAEDRRDKPLPLVRMTARVEPEWLIDLFPEHIHESARSYWNEARQRVEARSSLCYDQLVLTQSQVAPEPEAAAALLAEKAMEAGLDRFPSDARDRSSLKGVLARIEFAGMPAPDVAAAVRQLCIGLRSFADLKDAMPALPELLEQQSGARRLNEIAPASIRLPGGRRTPVHYEAGKPPWIASRLQDFFGMTETPRIGTARTPVVVHLLAPNHRPVQTTSDLAGFWQRLYPQVRRELMRRYPRHAWPERPC